MQNRAKCPEIYSDWLVILKFIIFLRIGQLVILSGKIRFFISYESDFWIRWFENAQQNYTCPQCRSINSAGDLKCRKCGEEPSSGYVAKHKRAIEQYLKNRMEPNGQTRGLLRMRIAAKIYNRILYC